MVVVGCSFRFRLAVVVASIIMALCPSSLAALLILPVCI